MKVLALPIEMLNIGRINDIPEPIRFRYMKKSGELKTVQIDRILETRTTNLAGIPAHVYRCQSEIDGITRRYEVKYTPKTTQWELYRYIG